MHVNPSQLITLLTAAIPARLPILITGAPGVGKSDIVAQAAALTGAEIILSHPAVADPTDAKGLPWPKADKDEATFLPFGELARALKATQPTVWFLDDFHGAVELAQVYGTLAKIGGSRLRFESVCPARCELASALGAPKKGDIQMSCSGGGFTLPHSEGQLTQHS